MNNLYLEAEKLGGQSYLEGCLACLTAYTIFLCMETHYEKVRLMKDGYILFFFCIDYSNVHPLELSVEVPNCLQLGFSIQLRPVFDL